MMLNDNYISETITTIKTTYVPFGSAIIAIDESENRTRYSLTVSEIFDRKHIALNGERDISLFLFLLLLLLIPIIIIIIINSFRQKAWPRISSYRNGSDPGNFDIISKLGIGRRQFLILAGKFQLIDSPWGK